MCTTWHSRLSINSVLKRSLSAKRHLFDYADFYFLLMFLILVCSVLIISIFSMIFTYFLRLFSILRHDFMIFLFVFNVFLNTKA